MAVFLVVALKNSSSVIDNAISRRFSDHAYKIEAGKWAVNTDLTTSKELSIALEINSSESHLIVPIRSYYGRAQNDFWEWLAAQTERANA